MKYLKVNARHASYPEAAAVARANGSIPAVRMDGAVALMAVPDDAGLSAPLVLGELTRDAALEEISGGDYRVPMGALRAFL